MPFVRAGQLARPVPTVRPDDALGLVAENLRAAGGGAVAVVEGLLFADEEPEIMRARARRARVLGVIDERDLARGVLPVLERQEALRRELSEIGVNSGPLALVASVDVDDVKNDASSALLACESIAELKARDVMQQDFGIVPAFFSLHNALLAFERFDCAALPVMDGDQTYLGMISRADIVAALGQQMRPPVIGGMATPLGVWLTTGTHSAGAPPFGLFLSGIVMGAGFVATYFLMLLGLALVNPQWAAMFVSGRLGIESASGDTFNLVISAVHSLLFLVMFRLMPLAGIHAAEHQTVWAIERGLPLTAEVVRQMPRAHPRCGTNLMAFMSLVIIIMQHLPSWDASWIMLTLVFVFLVWRNFGELLQNNFTTRPATACQLESGLRAGRELLVRFQEQPHALPSFSGRLFNSGIVYSAAGLFLMLSLLTVVQNWLESWVLRGLS